jgi:hypothetical protein
MGEKREILAACKDPTIHKAQTPFVFKRRLLSCIGAVKAVPIIAHMKGCAISSREKIWFSFADL